MSPLLFATRWLSGQLKYALLGVLCTAPIACEPAKRETQEAGGQVQAESAQEAKTEKDLVRAAAIQSEEKAIPLRVREADYAITKLRLDEAAELLDGQVGPDAARARARLAIYRADCEGAMAHLVSPAVREAEGADMLVELAPRCEGATVGGIIIDDTEKGVWLRLQDDADRILVPLILDVAVRARATLEKDLGEELPRPLRIDLVRDLFSLSAVSGLPLEAAETTGTVAVARWGRVTMISPRAIQHGFPWADTLAHEITHLLISKATADRAPLWLQEGIAKRQEHRWRAAQAFDDADDFSRRSYDAQVQGQSIGVDQIGPSIAMLPSAQAASIAFAEVTSFMEYWIDQNGPRALGFLLRDMEVAPSADSAMRSVSGYGVSGWQLIWRDQLTRRFAEELLSKPQEDVIEMGPRQLGRSLRLAELLTVDGSPAEAAELTAPDLDRAPHSAALRYLIARAGVLSSRDDVQLLLGSLKDVKGANAGWLALRARSLSETASSPEAEALLAQAEGLDPLLAEVACGGRPWVGKEATNTQEFQDTELDRVRRRELCLHARSLPVRGSR